MSSRHGGIRDGAPHAMPPVCPNLLQRLWLSFLLQLEEVPCQLAAPLVLLLLLIKRIH